MKENRCVIVSLKYIPEVWNTMFHCGSFSADRNECKYFKRRHSNSELCLYGYGNICKCVKLSMKHG